MLASFTIAIGSVLAPLGIPEFHSTGTIHQPLGRGGPIYLRDERRFVGVQERIHPGQRRDKGGS